MDLRDFIEADAIFQCQIVVPNWVVRAERGPDGLTSEELDRVRFLFARGHHKNAANESRMIHPEHLKV